MQSAQPQETKKAGKVKQNSAKEDLFSSTQIVHIQIEIPEASLEVLRGYSWGGFGGQPQSKRPSVPATIREGGKVYTNVTIHLKGAAGSFRPIDSEPALTLNFEKQAKGQKFHGLQRLSLNNSVQDRSLLNEQVCRELFAAAGVPVPRATHANVELNGRDLGVYVLTEAFNKQFLARHFKNPNGNLYDGGFLKDITDDLEKSSGPNPEDRSDLKRLADAASEPNLTNRWARMGKLLDLDRFISFLALDVIMCNWDGYALNKNNFRIYHDPDSDKIVFMPHGLDQMFGVMRAGTDMPIFPRMSGIVAQAVLVTPQGRQAYRDRLAQLMTNVFHAEAVTNRVWKLAANLQPVLAQRGTSSVRSHQREVAAFCNRIVERDKSVREQLAAPDTALKFDSGGIARFTGWQSKSEFGKPILEETNEGGKPLLHISAANGSCVGVWTVKLRLEPGRYRFEGKAKSQGVSPEPGDRKAGAGLRISGRRLSQKLLANTGWTDVAFDFDVGMEQAQFNFMAPIEDAVPSVELICELRAAKGEVWFDRDTLRLVRK